MLNALVVCRRRTAAGRFIAALVNSDTDDDDDLHRRSRASTTTRADRRRWPTATTTIPRGRPAPARRRRAARGRSSRGSRSSPGTFVERDLHVPDAEPVTSTSRCSPVGTARRELRPRARPVAHARREARPSEPTPYTLVLLRHGESEWNAKNLFTGWVDVALTEKGRAEAVRGGELLVEAGRAARRAAHLAAAPRDHHRAARARRVRPALDPGAPVVAAQRAALRRPAGQGQEGDDGGVRRGAVHALAPLLRHPAAAARRRRRVLPGRATRVRRPARRDRAAHRVPQGRRRADAALLVRRDRAGPARRPDRAAWPRTATACGRW